MSEISWELPAHWNKEKELLDPQCLQDMRKHIEDAQESLRLAMLSYNEALQAHKVLCEQLQREYDARITRQQREFNNKLLAED